MDMSQSPENTVLRSDYDASLVGLYASLIAGGLMLAYAIYYVTAVNVTDDLSFLTLGVITGTTSLSVIGMHEWFRHQHGPDRPENPIEEYGGAIAVLMGTLSVVWLTRYAVYFAGLDKGWIEVQEGPVWMPVWLPVLQSVCVLLVMEISTRSIQRHSLGTFPRTVVVLAPLSLVYSGIEIWLDYARGGLEVFVTFSVLLMVTSSILYSLRLGRAFLYLTSAGFAVALPIFMALRGWGSIEFASLLVPIVVVVGITATDRSLSRKMIENGSGVVVSAILFSQLIASINETPFVLADLVESRHPFGLTFWLWLGLLVGWFAPTTMQRTPAMPIGLALALALLADEAALVGWAVGIAAFTYLETRPQARDWVVRLTYCAMMASWFISSASLASKDARHEVLATSGEFSLTLLQAWSFLLLPTLLLLGFWAQRRGRLAFFDGPAMLLLLASINAPLLSASGDMISVLIVAASLYQLHLLLGGEGEHSGAMKAGLSTLAVTPVVASVLVQVFDDPANLTIITRVLPIVAAVALFAICHLHRGPSKSLMMRPELAAILSLTLIFLFANLFADTEFGEPELDPSQAIILTLFCLGLVSALLSFEGGAVWDTTPLEKLVGMGYLLPASIISAGIIVDEGGTLLSLILRDALVASAPVIINLRTTDITDRSQEARLVGAATLGILLFVGMTDVSGGLLALPVFAVAVHRATKHVSTSILLALPVFAVIYSSYFHFSYFDDGIGGGVVWSILEAVPYLRETTDLLAIPTPRWASLMLFPIPAAAAFYLPAERSREDGSRYGPEQLFGPAVAALLGVAFLLPDVRTAPIIIVIALTAGAWKKGVVNWFLVNPVATLWASYSLIGYVNDHDFFSHQIDWEYSLVVAGMVSFAQYFFLQNGKLLENLPDDSANDQSISLLAWSSRAFGYAFILLSGGITWVLPFVSALLMGWDALRSGVPALVHLSVVIQLFTLAELLTDLNIDSDQALLWPVFVGIVMVALSWKQIDPYGGEIRFSMFQDQEHDVEKELGLFGSAFALLSMVPYSEYINFEASFGISVVILSLHHVIVGFQRDQGWRRLLSLVGMPSGLIITGTVYGSLTMVLMLFLAALTLIGQAVLYASRGGLEIGSTIEGESPIISEVGTPSPEYGQTPDVQGRDEEESEEDDSQSTDDESEANDSEDIPLPASSEGKSRLRETPPLFSSEQADFGIRLDSSLMSNMRVLIESDKTIDFRKWSPVLGISNNGSIVLNWEKKEEQ